VNIWANAEYEQRIYLAPLPMKQLLLLFLFFPLFLFSQSEGIIQIQHGRVKEQRRATLEDLVRQSDYIALVQLPNQSPDSLPCSFHDMGTGVYIISFKPIEVYKQTFPLYNEHYVFEHSINEQLGTDLYRQGERCYVFLNNNEAKTIGDAPDLRLLKNQSGIPSLLLGGLIAEKDINEKELKRLCEPSKFVKAALRGDTIAMKRMARKHVDFLNQFDEQSPVQSFYGFSRWLMGMGGIDGVMLDSCSAHIAIWPGWSDYYYWVNTPEGRKEYLLVVQHGKIFPSPFNHLRHGYSNKWVVLNVYRTDSARERLFENCERARMYEKQDLYNNYIRFYTDEGRLNWSVYNGPAHLDSESDLMRVKLKLYNTIDSAMYLRWPGKQNSGKKVIQFALQHQTTRKIYRELSNEVNFIHDETLGPEDRLVIAQDTLSGWFSLNDPFLEHTDASAAHRFEKLPPGAYSLMVKYDPYPEAVTDTLSWNPFCDSISSAAGYPFWIYADTVSRNFTIEAEVVQRSEPFVNAYGQHGYTSGVVRVLKNDYRNGPAVGTLIAWKLLVEVDYGWTSHSHPPTTVDILSIGSKVELDLIDSNAGGIVQTASGSYRLYGTPERYDSIRIK
jgi:hypothetical protein